MALPGIGNSISFDEIQKEFGLPTGNRFGNYRVTQQISDGCPTPVVFASFPLDDGIPQSGQIKFSDFYSKKLNVILDIFKGNTEYTINARDRFNGQSNKLTVVGGLKSVDTDVNGTPIAEGKKIRIVVNKKIGSGKGSVQKCALRTGTWPSSTDVKIDIFGKGKLSGAGGNGGNGANGLQDNGGRGGDGGSALGIEKDGTVITVHSGGIITNGFAGAGGGGAGRETSKNDRRSGGGGGGGGAGIPAGTKGVGGSPQAGTRDGSIAGQGLGNPTSLTIISAGTGYTRSYLSNSGRSTTTIAAGDGGQGGGGAGLRVNYTVDPCAGSTGAVSNVEVFDSPNSGNGAYFKNVVVALDRIPGEGGATATFRVEDWTGRGRTDTGLDGEDGTENFGGAGGGGGDNQDQAFGGAGGIGGDYLQNALNGNGSTTEDFDQNLNNRAKPGLAGSNGSAIRKTNNSINFSLINNGTVRGSTTQTGVFQD